MALSTADVREARRKRKLTVRLARARASVARADVQEARAAAAADAAEQELALADAGLKRSFWTGKVVPVRGSRRAQAHERRLFGWRKMEPTERKATPEG